MITRKIIVTSVSGSGKTTQVDKMLELCKTHHITKYKTTTTRKKRPEEIGDEYDFITEADFHQSISDGKFIEHANVYGNLYGLPYLEVSKHLNENTIGILDVQGASTFKSIYSDAILIFIMPPDLNELKERLLRRHTNDMDNINQRITAIDSEMEFSRKCDYTVPCGNLTEMTNTLTGIINQLLS